MSAYTEDLLAEFDSFRERTAWSLQLLSLANKAQQRTESGLIVKMWSLGAPTKRDVEKKQRAEEKKEKQTEEDKAQRAKEEQKLEWENKKKYDAIYGDLGEMTQKYLDMAMRLADKGKNTEAASHFGIAHLALFKREKTLCRKKYVFPEQYYLGLVYHLRGEFWGSPPKLKQAMLSYFDDFCCSCQGSECQQPIR